MKATVNYYDVLDENTDWMYTPEGKPLTLCMTEEAAESLVAARTRFILGIIPSQAKYEWQVMLVDHGNSSIVVGRPEFN